MAIQWSMDQDWRFYRGDVDSGAWAQLNDSGWELVCLPHTGRLEPADCSGQQNYLGILWYRKRFICDPSWAGQRAFLHFGGAKHIAEVWLDGCKVGEHLGGYLPFSYDVTQALGQGGEHVLAVRLDNTDHGDIPPGKPQDNLDFCYHSGLYRHVWLEICGAVHVDDAPGAVFVSYPRADAQTALVHTQVRVINQNGFPVSVSLACAVEGEASQCSQPFTLYMNEARTVSLELELPAPRLWSPEEPNLYPLVVSVYAGGKLTDQRRLSIGVRRFAFNERGFFINGQPLMLSGANKHQEYPYLGDALPDSLHWRDVAKLKSCGFNFIRPGHYPHADAFFEACDTLGMLCVVPTPGWQWFQAEGPFRQRVYDDIRQMVLAYRNHPCVALWEPILNETEYDEAFARDAYRIVHENLPADQCYAACDLRLHGGAYYDVGYGQQDPFQVPGRALFIREYGDNYVEGYGRMKTLRRVSRGTQGFYEGGDNAMTRSALERMLVYNRLLHVPRLAGMALWTGMDHNRAYMDNIAATGVFDLWRIPKHAAYLYASQLPPEKRVVLHPCTHWAAAPEDRRLTVFTNCDEVEAWVDGRSLGRKKPDAAFVGDPQNTLALLKDIDASQMAFLDDTRPGLPHPPVFFPVPEWKAGTLSLTGYLHGEPVARCSLQTPQPAARLVLRADSEGRPWVADGADIMMVRMQAVDENGMVDTACYQQVTVSVSGPARALVACGMLEAGEISLPLQAGKQSGEITVQAACGGLRCEPLVLASQACSQLFVPAPQQTAPCGPFVYSADQSKPPVAFQMLRTNAALESEVTASSFEAGHEPQRVLDQQLTTWWRAASDGEQWLLFDLHQTLEITSFQLGWLRDNVYYHYRVWISLDGAQWELAAENRVTGHSHQLDDIGGKLLRYIRVEIPGMPGQRAELIRFSAMRRIVD